MTSRRRILIAVAERSLGATRQQLTVLTGYKRSSRDTYLQRLRAAGHVVGTGTESDRICATPAGRASLGSDYAPLPKGPALIEYWRERLPGGELLIFDTLLRARPNALDRDTIAGATGYRRSSRDTYLHRLRGRGIVLIRPDGSVMLHEEFWGTPDAATKEGR